MRRLTLLLGAALLAAAFLTVRPAQAGDPVFSLIFNANTGGNFRPCPT